MCDMWLCCNETIPGQLPIDGAYGCLTILKVTHLSSCIFFNGQAQKIILVMVVLERCCKHEGPEIMGEAETFLVGEGDIFYWTFNSALNLQCSC